MYLSSDLENAEKRIHIHLQKSLEDGMVHQDPAYYLENITISEDYDLLKDCELIQFIIESYDNHNFRHLCNMINNSFINQNTHGVHAIITKKRFELNADRGKFDLINFTV